MNIKLAPLFISLALLSGNALADHVIKNLVPTEVRKSYDGLLVAMSATALDAAEERHDWTVLYVGGFAGGAAGTRVNTTQPYLWNSAKKEPYSYNTKAGAMGGGTVGYNWQLGKSPYVVGIEGELGYMGMKGRATDPGSPGSDGHHKAKINNAYGLIGGRLGYAYKRSLFYVKSGAVFVQTKTGYTDDCNKNPCGPGLLNISGKKNSVGYAIGGGIEQALPPEWFEQAKNISIKVEYLYLGVERSQNISNVIPGAISGDRIRGIHTAKIGINYHFDGF
jgi:outer membrane immunogenic protein